MNEEELKKGCGKDLKRKTFENPSLSLYCGIDVFVSESVGLKVILCPTCKARLEGFQKGKLEQKKEDIKIIDKTLIKLANVLHPSNQDYDWYKIIYTELKKEIGGGVSKE